MADQAAAPTMKTVFHIDLSDAHPGEEYYLHACGKRHTLVAHTPDSRRRARAHAPHLEAVADANLTHYTAEALDMPADQVVRVHLKHTLTTFPDAKGAHGVGHVALHIPPSPEKLQSMLATGIHHQQYVDYVSTAKTLIFHHPDLYYEGPRISRYHLQLHGRQQNHQRYVPGAWSADAPDGAAH